MPEKPTLSSRSVLKSAVALGTVAWIGLDSHRKAQAQQKASKDAMKYQDHPDGDQSCSTCMQFAPPSSCKVVEGAVSPNGYCIAWAKKA